MRLTRILDRASTAVIVAGVVAAPAALVVLTIVAMTSGEPILAGVGGLTAGFTLVMLAATAASD